MIRSMITNNFDQKIKSSTGNKLKKCILSAAATVFLTGCTTMNQFNRTYDYQEVPHLKETSLSSFLLMQQKPVDDKFLRAQTETINQICSVNISDIKANAENPAENEKAWLQKLSADCNRIKGECQRVACEYKRMENATRRKHKISSYEILNVDNDLFMYDGRETFEYMGKQLTNQGLSEDVDINTVRAAAQHSMHKFSDAATQVFIGAEEKEVKALEKYELGYSVFSVQNIFVYNRLIENGKLSFDEKICQIVDHAIDDVVRYATYEYRHDPRIQDPARLEVELKTLFNYMEEALNAYYPDQAHAPADMKLLNQVEERIIQLLPRMMFGDEKQRTAMVKQIATLIAVDPLTRKLEKANIDLSKFTLNKMNEQNAELTR